MRTKKFYVVVMLVMLCRAGFGQTTMDDLNNQLRDVLKNLKRAPGQTPFLFDMASHVLSDSYFTTHNDTSIINQGMFNTMYEEMRSSAYDTTIMAHVDSIKSRMKKSAINDTVFMSMLNADYAVFTDDAFTTEGEYYFTTDTTIADVPNRNSEPFNIRNVFVSTISTPISYFRKVVYVLDTNYIFARNSLLSNYSQSDLNPKYARWKVDFGDGAGWREFDPKKRNLYVITYKDTGTYYISSAIFYCDPFPKCNSYPSKLSKTAIYILTNKLPTEQKYTYEFSNITVGLYPGCGKTVNGVYIPNKPLIILEGIDLPNNHTIADVYEDYVIGTDKRLNELVGSGYDFYIVNFNDSKLDIRQNAKGVIELLNFLKKNIATNEQFVVIGESMGGVIARYALTYMETDDYKNAPNVPKPNQLHNTRLLITNDSPHQGAYVPIAFQMMYKNVANSSMMKVLGSAKHIFPVLNKLDEMAKLLDSKSVQQLLAYNVNANGPHVERNIFMDELIGMNPQTNGYPKYCKLMSITDGLLTGQHQLKTDTTLVLQPGERIFNFHVKTKVIIFRFIKIDFLDYNLDLFAVDKNNPGKELLQVTEKYFTIKIKGCLRHLFRLKFEDFVNCAVKSMFGVHPNVMPTYIAQNVSENYETVPGGLFPSLALMEDYEPKDIDLLIFKGKFIIDRKSGNVNFKFTTANWLPGHYIATPELEINIGMPYLDFGFIPVQSAIDLDYYRTQNFASDLNLLNGDVQNTIFQFSPFHVISGFENFNSTYPKNLNAGLGNKNWSHGYFTNREIDIVLHHGYLTREIGDEILYLNNLDLGERDADFSFRTINMGYDNPFYKYHLPQPLKQVGICDRVYSKYLPFHFMEPGRVSIVYQEDYVEGENKLLEGILFLNKTTLPECDPIQPLNRSIQKVDSILNSDNVLSKILVYPNPLNDILFIAQLAKNVDYKITFSNLLGQEIMSLEFNSLENGNLELDVSELPNNSIYIISISSAASNSSKQKIFKF